MHDELYAVLFIPSFIFSSLLSGSAYKLVCYVTNWAQYRAGPAKFTPDKIDPFLCTHLILAFAGMNNNQITTTERNDEILYKQLNALKDRQVTFKLSVFV